MHIFRQFFEVDLHIFHKKVTGHKFEKAPDSEDLVKRIEGNVLNYLKL